MARTAAGINVKLRGGTAELIEDMEKASASIRKFGSTGVTETRAVRSSMEALRLNIFNSGYAAEQFAEKVLHLGNFARAAFPIVGGLAFIGVLGEAGSKLAEFFTKLREGPEKAAEAFRGLVNPLRLSNEEMQVANDKLENSIAKLEDRRPNTLKLMLDEAIVSALKLGSALEKDALAFQKALIEQAPGVGARLLGVSDVKGLEETEKKYNARIDEINDKAKRELEAARNIEDAEKRQFAVQVAQGVQADELIEAAKVKQAWYEKALATEKALGASQIDNRIRLLALYQGRNEAVEEQRRVALTITGEGDERRKLAAEANVAAAKEAAAEEKKQEEAWAEAFREEKKQITEWHKMKLALAGELERLSGRQATEYERAYKKSYATPEDRAAALAAASANDLRTGAGLISTEGLSEMEKAVKSATPEGAVSTVSPLDQLFGKRPSPAWDAATKALMEKAKEAGELHKQTLAGLNEELQILRQHPEVMKDENGQAFTQQQIQLAIRNVEKERLELQIKMAQAEETVRGSLAQFFLEMRAQTNVAGETLYQALKSALDRTSENLAKLFTGQKTDWARSFQGIGQQMVQSSIHGLMQKGLGAFGSALGLTKRDGSTPASALFVQQVGLALGGIGGGAPLPGVLGRLLDLGGIGKPAAAGSPIAIAADLAEAAIPHAGGGDVSPGMAYVVGERGPELLVGASGRVLSNAESRGALGGGNAFYTIDARGTDTALADQRFRRSLEIVHGSAIAISAAVQQERARRIPQGGRG